MWCLLLFLIPFSYFGFYMDHLIQIPLIFFTTHTNDEMKPFQLRRADLTNQWNAF